MNWALMKEIIVKNLRFVSNQSFLCLHLVPIPLFEFFYEYTDSERNQIIWNQHMKSLKKVS